jgi:hypothetical protein
MKRHSDNELSALSLFAHQGRANFVVSPPPSSWRRLGISIEIQ